MSGVSPLTIEELETGLRLLGRRDTDPNAFWDEHIAAFRQTVLLAIRDTSDALLSPEVTIHWRTELETQLPALVEFLELADRYISKQSRDARLRSRIH